MSAQALEFEADFKDLSPAGWIQAMTALGDEHGYFAHLGDKHMALFLDAGPKLIVTFEDAEEVRDTYPDAAPLGFRYVREDGWSHLAIMSVGPSWFREESIYRHFDRLTDDGFFDEFEEVLFVGDYSGGYAAAAYSVAAPGARVFMTRPQATLDPRKAAFDRRHLDQRRVDFTSRYGYGPEMIDAAQKAYVVFDPTQRLDAIHAALFTRDNVIDLRAFGFGANIASTLRIMQIAPDLIRGAMDGSLEAKDFHALNRARRDQVSYRRNVVKLAAKHGHPRLAATLCATQLRDKGFDPFYAKQLKELERAGFVPLGEALQAAAE